LAEESDLLNIMIENLQTFFAIESTSFIRYWFEQLIFALVSWIPSLLGIGFRALLYKLILNADGLVFIQTGVILKQPRNITLHNGVYLDHRVYLHGCPHGIEIEEGTRIMHNAEIHVFNFRNLPNARIKIGKNCVIGPYNVIMGHGGTVIGNHVILAPRVSILPVNHNYDDRAHPVRDQGITATGIIIEDDVWVGAHAIILDGVRIGRGSVVGAGSVVTRDVPAYSLVAGTPAKVVRTWSNDSDRAASQDQHTQEL
jgi:acetyltransferase-like isoleucine patch superfamily enzyme